MHYAPEKDYMTPSETYRTLALTERKSAAKAALSSRRAMHERSAMAWDKMAHSAEDTVAKAAVNAAAKAGGIPQAPMHRLRNWSDRA